MRSSVFSGEYLDEHGSPLGLMYAVYCDGDTQI